MMGKPIRTVQANRDLLEIWVHIAEQNPEAADRTLERIGATCQTLADSPGIGRRREGFGPGLRSFPAGNYIIFYRPNEDGIEVIRVVHGARDIEVLFPSEEEGV